VLASAAMIASVATATGAVVGATSPAWHSATEPKPVGTWYAVAYNNQTWVAAGRGTNMAYSSDAQTWHEVAIPSGSWQSLAYGKGIWVSLSSTGSVPGELTSVSGKLWTSHNAPSGQWSSVAFGNGMFVASSFNGDIMTSKDGLHWTLRVTGNGHESFYAVAYGNGRFVVVDDNQGDFATSTNGVNWSITHAASSNDGWGAVAFGNGTFVAFDGNDTSQMASSINGTVWSYHHYAKAGANWSGAFGCNEFFSVTNSNGSTGAQYQFSMLGATWSQTPVAVDGFSNNWPAVAYGNGKFVAVDSTGPITWRAATQPCKQNAPNPPTNVRGSFTKGKITVSWNAPSYGGVKATKTYVVKVTSDGFLQHCYSSTTSCTVSGLTAKHQYLVSVTAVNAAGFYSAPTDPISVLAPATSNFAITELSPVRLVNQPVSAWISGAAPYWALSANIGAQHTSCVTNGFGECQVNFTVANPGQQIISASYVASHVTHHATNATFASLAISGLATSYTLNSSIAVSFTGGVPNAYGAVTIEGVTTSAKLDGFGNGVVNASAPSSVGSGSTSVNIYDDGQLLESVSINLTT
jgi:hypothetical protein